MEPRPEIRVVAAAILREGRVLAAQRGPAKARAGLWELPGGKVEPGEDDAAALRREIREELGVDVHVDEHLDERVHAYPELTVRLVAWRCRVVQGQPRASEHAALRWLTASELTTVPWSPADVPLLPAVRAALQGAGAHPGG